MIKEKKNSGGAIMIGCQRKKDAEGCGEKETDVINSVSIDAARILISDEPGFEIAASLS